MDANSFTYAGPEDPAWKRIAIGAIEIATGRDRLRRLYEQRQCEGWRDGGFFSSAIAALKLDVKHDATRLAALPAAGPLVVVANHPFGVLDGVVLCSLLERVRPDFRVLTNAVLLRAPEMREKMLPIDFSDAPAAQRSNVASRTAALDHLRDGGCVAIFPAGAVATSPDFLGRAPAIDAPWTPFLARLVTSARAPVAPVFFPGQNSRLFQMISHVSMTARLALFFHEVNRRVGTAFPVEIGDIVPHADLAGFADRRELVAELRRRTLALSARARL